jgi:hypothetical protein
VTYWVRHSSSQGVFPRWTHSKSCKEDEVDGGKNIRHRVHDIQGFILSHLWVPLQRMCCSFVFNATFFQAHLLSLIFLLTGETVHPSTGRVEPVRGCLNNPSRLV